MTCVTGVSGSGKSSLVIETLFNEAQCSFTDRKGYLRGPQLLKGLELLDKVIDIDQSPIGRTPRSNPATYTGVMTPIRELLARLPESSGARGYQPGRFSFNLKGGRCETCEGDGVIRIAMHFLPDIYVTCERCQGKRYNQETLDIRYKGKNIAEILQMTVEEALEFFQNVPPIAGRPADHRRCRPGLPQPGAELGDPFRRRGPTGEAGQGAEPALHRQDPSISSMNRPPGSIRRISSTCLRVLGRLVDGGNTVVVIEHNLDVIKTADWVIDIGPEGGSGGGQVIAAGTPEAIAHEPKSYTGMFLKQFLNGNE